MLFLRQGDDVTELGERHRRSSGASSTTCTTRCAGSAASSSRSNSASGHLERPAVDLAADDAERRTARSLVDEVRLEHDRTQAGLAAIAFYEERLARLEQAANPGVS